jgi:MFS family permease
LIHDVEVAQAMAAPSAFLEGRMGLIGRSDIFYLYAARSARGFGDGFAAIILPAYLSELGFSPFQIGVVATAALLGSAILTLAIGIVAPRYDLRTLLLACAGLMIATGVAMPSSQHFIFIALIAFIGTMNPTTGDTGVHVPLEQASLAHGVTDKDRTHTFARYSLIGALSIAAGALTAGTPDWLAAVGMDRMVAFKIMFYLYAALGLLAGILYFRLSPAVAPPANLPQKPQAALPPTGALGPSRGPVYKLAALFSLDAFAGGFTVQSLLALWLFERFGLSLAAAGEFFFWSNVLAAFSFPVAARLGQRFGLVNTMVFTHIPSSICIIMAAFSSSLTIALLLLLVRSAFSQMDVPTRTSFVMAVVTPTERTAAASITAVPRSLASSVSPAIAGALLSTSFIGLPLVICGTLKIVYDLVLLFSFRHLQPPKEKAPR